MLDCKRLVWAAAALAVLLCHVALAAPCPPLDVVHNSDTGGYVGERFDWRDSDCRTRSALMVYNDRNDPAGHRGGYLRWLDYQLDDNSVRHVQGSFNGHPGWGYTVNHFGNTAHVGYSTLGSWQLLLEGRHHAILRYTRRVPLPGPVDTTIDWLFATGRDHPLWAVTFDASPSPPDSIDADTRSPYGDLQWDGGANANVDGIGWGDRYRFRTTTSPVTLQSGWDYSQTNTIPHVLMWANAVDAEMGAVQTQSMTQHDAGGYWFYPSWGSVDPDGPMPQDWNWTYQLNQYEIPFTLGSKRMSWGSNYGAIGQNSYNAYGDGATLDGYPYNSYSVYMVLGQHSAQPTLDQITQVERAQMMSVTATVGTVRTTGAAGINRPDSASWSPPGYNPAYGTFEIEATNNSATIRLAPSIGMVRNPILVLHGFTATSATVMFNGATAAADDDYFATFDAANQRLWLTIRRDVQTPLVVSISATTAPGSLFANGFE
jgi:hypothetical protein